MKRPALLILLACFPIMAVAADIPEIVEKDEQTTQELCIARVANDCLNTVCPNSPDINCSDNCQDDAENKCQEMAEE